MKHCLMDHEFLMQNLTALSECNVVCKPLARSILGREIPLITLGHGKRAVLYVGAHRGTDGLASAILLDFINDYLKQYERLSTVYEYPMRYLFEDRRIYVIPMLNPDGVEYALHGICAENPLRERVIKMNGSEDFSAWRANARGVDLGHNYDAGFENGKKSERNSGAVGRAREIYCGEYPESEPETAALCRFLRQHREEIKGVLSLHVGTGEIFCSCGNNLTAKTVSVGRVLSRFTGYRLTRPESILPNGTLADWCIAAMHRPAFSMYCGGVPSASRAVIYEHLRRTLFSFPCIV